MLGQRIVKPPAGQRHITACLSRLGGVGAGRQQSQKEAWVVGWPGRHGVGAQRELNVPEVKVAKVQAQVGGG